MCLAVPGKIKKIDGGEAVVDYEVEERTAKLLEEGYKKGDYVVVQGGFVMLKIPEKEAKIALEQYKESFRGT